MRLSRSGAISLIKKRGVVLLTTATHFANVNARKPVWWFDIPIEKFTSGHYTLIDLLLCDGLTNQLHHLQVPTEFIRNQIDEFKIREDKQVISLELSSQTYNLFQDVRPGSKRLSFAKFLVQ